MSQGGSKIQSNNIRSHASSGGRPGRGCESEREGQRCLQIGQNSREDPSLVGNNGNGQRIKANFFLKKGDAVVIDRFRFLFEYFSMAWVMKSEEIV